MTQGKNSNTHSRRTVHLPVILWILPLLALNIGFRFFSNIDIYWQKHEQEISANHEVEALSAGSDFSYQYARRAGEFAEEFKTGIAARYDETRLIEHLNRRTARVFRSPFPDYEIYTFKKQSDKETSHLLHYQNHGLFSRRVMTMTFSHLVHVSQGGDISDTNGKRSEDMLNSLLGNETRSDMLARSQKGKTTFVLFRGFPCWFLWDYFTADDGNTYGFYLISRFHKSHATAGRLLALRDLRDSKQGLGAFVPVYSDQGGIVVQQPLNKSKTFVSWARKLAKIGENKLENLLASGTPEITELGKYLAFTYLGKSQTHFAVYLTPQIQAAKRPLWLFLINLAGIGLLALLILRGLLLNQWPEFNLRIRFILTYLLTATLPISLLFIASYGYITQYRRAVQTENLNQLQLSIKQFDTRKAYLEETYRATFDEVLKDDELKKILQKEGSESEAASRRILAHYLNDQQKLPLLCFAIVDENGKGIRYYGGQSKAEADPTIDAFSYALTLMLHKHIKASNPDYKLPEPKPTAIQKTAIEAYQSMANRNMVDEVDSRRSFPIKRRVGAKTATQMHDIISIDGQAHCILFIVWDDQALDREVFSNSLNQIALNNPGLHFIAFKTEAQGMTYLVEPNRHIGEDFIDKARDLARLAQIRGSYAANQYEDLSLVALPAKKYEKLVIVGGSYNFILNQAISYRMLILLAILLLSIIIILLASYYSAKLILDPIETLKAAIDKVANGELNTEIESHSQDELGTLCREFSTMAIGLRERKRLATLLSDQAIDAITRIDNSQRLLDNTTFNGVALVSDIRNFTGLCEEYPPDDITDLLNEHFASMATIISSSGGRIYKFIGDAIEAVFPEKPGEPEDAATRAFNAASMMLIKARQINQTRSKRKLFTYRIGIGLAYGTMHSGSIGSLDTRLDYAIIGEPLKLAAQLEGLSSHNQDFPLVIDSRLNETLGGYGLIFKEFSQIDGQAAFTLHEIGGSEALTAFSQRRSQDKTSTKESESIEKFVVGSVQALSTPGMFMLGILLIMSVVGGIIFATNIRADANRLRIQNSAKLYNQRLLEQLSCENAAQIGFEMQCRRLVTNIEQQASENADFLSKDLANTLKPFIDETSSSYLASRMAIYHIKSDFTTATATCQSKRKFVYGWNASQAALLGKQAALNRLVAIDKTGKLAADEHKSPEFVSIFGNKLTGGILHYECIGQANEIVPSGKKEYFYWDYLVTRGKKLTDKAFAKKEDARIIGYFMASRPVDEINNSPGHLIESYNSADRQLALIDPQGLVICSERFPYEIKAKLTYSEDMPENPYYELNHDYINIGQQRFLAVVCSNLEKSSIWSAAVFYTALLILTILAGSLWWKTSIGESFINTSLTAKLWLTLLLASIIPITTVYFVFCLFSDEDYNVNVSKTRTELHRTIDRFELRETFTDQLAWRMLNRWSKSSETLALAEKFNLEYEKNKHIASSSIEAMDELIASWFDEHKNLDSQLINFVPRDVVIAGNGWTHVSSGKGSSPSQFAVMLKGIARNIANKRIIKGPRLGLDGQAVQSEIIVETGLQTVRSLFGDDIYVRMANSVEIPALLNAISGTIGIVTYVVPDIDNPEYLVMWMMLFDYENYLSRLSNRYIGRFEMFSAISHRYGSMLSPWIADSRHEMARIGSWITSANLPVSSRLERDGRGYLVEGRPGVAQMTSFLIAAAPEAPIQAKLATNRLFFGLALFLSIVLILFMAKNAAADILNPVEELIMGMKFASCENYAWRINLRRGDELGQLCESFNSMMRGLEEKNLMGKMLSKSAVNFAEQNGSKSSIGEFVFLYMGIPSFTSWVAGSSVDQMFIDLREQIAAISGFVISAGGDIDKIVGDKMLAVFAVDGDLSEAVASACKAATSIIMAESRANLPFPIAIGINSGKVITGLLGVGEKRDFTVIGDAVNVAARIEGVAENLRYQRCLMSERVFASLKHGVVAREYGEVELKGKAMPIKVYQLSI